MREQRQSGADEWKRERDRHAKWVGDTVRRGGDEKEG